MNKNITQSIQNLLYKKTAEKIEEIRNEIAASIFEEKGMYTGAHEDFETAARGGDEHFNEPPDLEKKCKEHVNKTHPNASASEKKKLMDECMGHSIQEAKKPAPKKPAVKKPKPAPAAPMAPISQQGRQSALDLMTRVMLGMGTIGEALDPVGKEDADIDNDGKPNTPRDKYLLNRRKAIGNAISAKKRK